MLLCKAIALLFSESKQKETRHALAVIVLGTSVGINDHVFTDIT